MKKLSCPSCGANLELPETLDVAHCMYCGGKIILRDEKALDEMVNLDRFVDLARRALDARNYDEALNYSNKILEINTKHIEAWIIKAEAVFMQTTSADDKYETAIQYLKIASDIDSADNRVEAARTKIRALYVYFHNNLGLENMEVARKIYKTYTQTYSTSYLYNAASIRKGKEDSIIYFGKAMNHFITASLIDSTDLTILRNIEILYNDTNSWINWKSPAIKNRLDLLYSIRNKEFAVNKIPSVENDLKNNMLSLKKLEGKNGFFDKMSRDNIMSKISSLKKELNRLRQMASFEP